LDGQEIPQKAFVLNFAPDGFLIKRLIMSL
jgi:hypothetical protein